MYNYILIGHKQNKFDKSVEAFFRRHPYAALFWLFIGLPVFMLSAVFICSAAVMLPISLIMGWL